MHPFAATLISGILLGGWVILLTLEAQSNRRVLGRLRAFLDRGVLACVRFLETHAPELNRHFLRQMFHYIVHQTLSLLLAGVRYAERVLRRVLHINRSRAKVAREPRSDSHLSHMLAHKETTALSEEEKFERKEKALRGNHK